MNERDIAEQSFNNGYEKGFANAKPKWIPVRKELPKDGERVLVYCYMNDDIQKVKRRGNRWYSTWDNTTEIVYVSHWMHLPEPPKGE